MATHTRYRTKLCRNFVAGQCTYGDKCTFIHPPPAPFPPFNILSPFVRQLVLSWSAMPTSTTEDSIAPVAGEAFTAASCKTPPLSSSAASASSPGPGEHVIMRPANWRTKPCKHFIRTHGCWCPVGDACNFIHDPTLSSGDSGLIRNDRNASLGSHVYTKEPRNTKNTTMGMTSEHCWAYNQGMCGDPACQLLHPEDVTPYIAYTPCLRWPDCPDGVHCAFQHHVPIPVTLPVPVSLPLPPTGVTVPEMVTAIPNHVARVSTPLPCGSYEFNGTTYFTPQVAVVSLPTKPPTFYDHATNAHNICDSTVYAHSQRSGIVEASNYVYDQAVHTFEDLEGHKWSDPRLLEGKEQGSVAVQHAIQAATPDLEISMDRLTSTREDEFPYRPPKNQRVGHTRRISVQMKRVHAPSVLAAA